MKKIIALMLTVVMVFGTITGCTSTEKTEDKSTEAVLTVTDVSGREVAFEKMPETFVVANYIFNFLLVGGRESLSKVVGLTMDGWEDTRFGEYTALTEAYPEIKDMKSIGGYHDNVLDRELILEMRPDCLIINDAQYVDNETSIPVWEAAGIEIVVLDYSKMIAENHLLSTEILGKLLGKEETASELCKAYTNGIETVNERVAELSEEEKDIIVHMELGNMGADTIGNSYDGILWDSIVTNVGAESISHGKLDATAAPLDKEYILLQNPDVIIIGGAIWTGDTENTQMRMGLTVESELAQERLMNFYNRDWWQNVEAIKNGEVYGVDHGSLRNILDYTYTEFIAKVLYPELFEDFDPQAEYEAMLEKYLPEVTAPGTFMIKLDL